MSKEASTGYDFFIYVKIEYHAFADLQKSSRQQIVNRTQWHLTPQCPVYPLVHPTFTPTLLVCLLYVTELRSDKLGSD